MPQVCPYCKKEYNALKNHVRLSSGNGHGTCGDYPNDFLKRYGESPDSATEDRVKQRSESSTPISIENSEEYSEVEPDHTIDMASSELDQFISVLRDEAYERGHQHGLDEGNGEGETSVASEVHSQEKPIVGTRKSAASRSSGVKMIFLGAY